MPTQSEHIQFAQAFFQQGRIARKSGDSGKAIDCFQETIRLQPDFIPAYNNLANLLQDQGGGHRLVSNDYPNLTRYGGIALQPRQFNAAARQNRPCHRQLS